MEHYDYLIVGAGLSGMVTAEQLSLKGRSCLIIDQRSHLGGNCFDKPDKNGVMYHVYGPHYFRTSVPRVREYLSRFTEWRAASYRIKVNSQGRLWSFPINLESYEEWLGKPATEEDFKSYLAGLPKLSSINNSRDVIVNAVGEEFFNLFYKGYTRKQWGRAAETLDASVTKRIPIRTCRDDRYFSDDFQALPKFGYTHMFYRIWEAIKRQCPASHMQLDTSLKDIRKSKQIAYDHLLYSGPLDEYFDSRLGELPYRSLRFSLECIGPDKLNNPDHPGFAQPALQVNYAGDEAFTRSVEVKHITGQITPYTNQVWEFPQEYEKGKNEPYYPVPYDEAQALAQKYLAMAKAEPNTTFLGRMALYRYINMDQVVNEALQVSETLK
ncbi:MAG: NAD(P)-binding protein [Methylacidiphilales bacterium]|nr:NAD(P)-binding protein [Candidatus Methylacidiphilales bacterium]